MDILRRAGAVVLDSELRRLDVAENWDDSLLELSHEAELVQTEVGVAIHRREDGDPDLAFSDGHVDLVEQPVSRLHVLAVQERDEAEAAEVVVQQPRHVPLRVHAPVVDEHVARGGPHRRPLAEEVAPYCADHGGGGTLHGNICIGMCVCVCVV